MIRCNAFNKSGARCKNPAILDGKCRTHLPLPNPSGGSAVLTPADKAAIIVAIIEVARYIVDTLEKLSPVLSNKLLDVLTENVSDTKRVDNIRDWYNLLNAYTFNHLNLEDDLPMLLALLSILYDDKNGKACLFNVA